MPCYPWPSTVKPSCAAVCWRYQGLTGGQLNIYVTVISIKWFEVFMLMLPKAVCTSVKAGSEDKLTNLESHPWPGLHTCQWGVATSISLFLWNCRLFCTSCSLSYLPSDCLHPHCAPFVIGVGTRCLGFLGNTWSNIAVCVCVCVLTYSSLWVSHSAHILDPGDLLSGVTQITQVGDTRCVACAWLCQIWFEACHAHDSCT